MDGGKADKQEDVALFGGSLGINITGLFKKVLYLKGVEEK